MSIRYAVYVLGTIALLVGMPTALMSLPWPNSAISIGDIAIHSSVGILSGTLFDVLRWTLNKRNPGLSSSIFLMGTFLRVTILFIYGIRHMFFGTANSGVHLQVFAASAFAGILFGVAYEAALSFYSPKQ